MTKRLPIAETALGAVTFSLAHVLPTLRVYWLPLLLLGALASYTLSTLFQGVDLEALIALAESDAQAFEEMSEDEFLTMIAPDPGALGGGILLAILTALVSVVVFIPLSTLLYRVAAEDEQMPIGLFYWQWGAREWTFLFTIIIYMVLFGGISLAIELAGGAAIMIIQGTGDVTIGWVAMLIPILVSIITIWLTLRTILVLPASAVEGQINIFSALKATGGNVFRILGSILVLVLIIIACLIGYGLIMMILSLLQSAISLSYGTESTVGLPLTVLTYVAMAGVSIFAFIALQLINYGWGGKAWAALRE